MIDTIFLKCRTKVSKNLYANKYDKEIQVIKNEKFGEIVKNKKYSELASKVIQQSHNSNYLKKSVYKSKK